MDKNEREKKNEIKKENSNKTVFQLEMCLKKFFDSLHD